IIPASGTTASATNVCAGESVTLTGSIPACYVSPTFQLEVSTDGGTTFSNATGSSTAQVYLADATGLYRVVITEGVATTISCAIQITVNALPVASISAAPSTSVCSGTTVNLTASATGTEPLTYQWQQNGIDVAGSTSTTFAAGTSGDYAVQVTSAAGCRVTTAATTVTVNALPALIISDPLPVCEPVTVDITKAAITTGSTLPAGAVLSYWTNSAATLALADPTAVAVSGTYYIKAEVPASGCSDIAPVKVAVNASPVLVVTDPASVCTPATIDLTDGAVTAGSVLTNATLSYWRDSGAVNALTNPGAVNVTGTYFIQAESAGGCTSIKSVNVEIRQSPTLTGPATVCVGSTAGLSTTGTPAVANAWVTSDATVATVSSSGVVTGISAGTVTITYTESNGCTATISITVNALPTLTGNNAFCAGTTSALVGSGTPALNNAWVSSNPSVASVSSTGVVTGLTGGSTTITYTNSSGCSKSLSITVFAVPVISGATALCSGTTTTLNATTTPAAATPWSSSDPAVATISDSGLLTAVAGGSATITFTNSTGCASTTVITVNQTPVISGPTVVCAGSTITLTGSGTPDATVPWISSDVTVAIISSAGVVSGVGAGTATITYKVSTGCTATSVVTVNPLPAITGSNTVCAESSITLTAAGGTAAAGNPWSTSNTSIATVSATGEVTGVAAGAAVITWTNSNGCASSLSVTVNAKPVISGTLTVCEGGSVSLSGSGTPAAENAWVSSSPAVATIDATGKVTAVSPGTTTITYTESSGCSTTATVTVNLKPVITGTPDLCSGSATTLSATGTPAVTNPWVSSDTQVATVSATGTVTGVAAGTSVITFTTAEGCSATYTVTVKAQPANPGPITGPAEVFELTTHTYSIDAVPGVSTYNWSLPTGWSGTSTTNSITVVAGTEGGVISVTVTVDGCTSAASTLTITMKPPMVLTEDDQLDPAVVDCDVEFNG
ncbi:MAG: beta strand repeat-containing protein, partial [Bacteroidota bacterium]